MTIYKAFVRPHLDFSDVIYIEIYGETFDMKWNLFNIISAYPYRELLEESQENNFTIAQRCALLSTVIDSSLKNTNNSILTQFLLFGKTSLDISVSARILNTAMNYIVSTNRLEENLVQYFVICNYYMFIYLTLFRVLMSFLRLYIHIHLILRFALIICQTIFTISSYLYPGVSGTQKFSFFVCFRYSLKKMSFAEC